MVGENLACGHSFVVQYRVMERIETENGRVYEVGPDPDTGEHRVIQVHHSVGDEPPVKTVICDVERVQVLRGVEARVQDDASADDIDAALILALREGDWFDAEVRETYPNGPREIIHAGE